MQPNKSQILAAFDQAIEQGRGLLYQDMPCSLLPDAVTQQAESDEDIAVAYVPRSLVESTKPVRFSGIASEEEISRTGHLFVVKGIGLDNYKKNPVLLTQHHAYAAGTMYSCVVGLVGTITKSGTTLRVSNIEFDEADDLAIHWMGKVQRRFIRMLSIGAYPEEWEYVEEVLKRGGPTVGYVKVWKSDLREISLCAIAANTHAFLKNTPTPLDSKMQELESQISKLADTINNAKQEMALRSEQAAVEGRIEQALALLERP